MNTHLQSKPFLNYHDQIRFLQSKGLIINDTEKSIRTLMKTSYYSLINGYKDCFKDSGSNLFVSGTTFESIYDLYIFDANLRSIFLKYILVVEQSIKSSISYHFSNLYGNGIFFYTNSSNYDYGNNLNDLQKLFKKTNSKLTATHSSQQVAHYLKVYKDVPLWVLTTDLTLGETASMYRYLKGHCKTLVCNDFHRIGRTELGKMLILLTKFRNVCAHGQRLFNYHAQDAITDCTAHKKLHIPKTDSLYHFGKSDLFAVVIALKYLLTPEDFQTFYYELKKAIYKYSPSENTLKTMGFPNNWMSILRIKVHLEPTPCRLL